ncbi:MAG: glycosyltransferase family 39 protein [Phycisphaerales bacterium]
MNLSTRHFTAAVVFIFLVALVARLGLTHRFVGLDAPPDISANSDQVDYEILAYHMTSGQGYAIVPGQPTATRTPGTSLTLAPVYALFGRSFALGRVWFCVLSALTCVLAVWLGTLCFNRVAGLFAGIGLALYPAHAYSAMHFVSETPFGFWMLSAMIATAYAYKRQRGGWGINVIAGVFWAMAVYSRPQLLLAVPIAGGLALLALAMRDREHFKGFAVQVVVLALVLSPWVLRNATVMGKPTLSTITGYGLWGSHNELTFNDPAYRGGWVKASELIDADHPLTGGEVERNAQATSYGKQMILAHIDQMPGLITAKLWRLVTPIKDTDNRIVQIAFAAGWIAVAPLMLIGLVVTFKRSPATAWLLLLPILATIASTVIYYGSDRFRDSVAPAFIVLAAVGVQTLLQRVARSESAEPIAHIQTAQQEPARAA